MGPLVYVLPVHNEEPFLAASVARARASLDRFPGSAVILVENGSRDRSWDLSQSLEASDGTRVYAFRELSAGIGYAYHRGLTEALARFGPLESVWAVLTAADLPFGFSDLDAALTHIAPRSSSRMLMGSKAHPESTFESGPKRRAMTVAYRLARRLALGMRVGDSQGTVFLRLDFAATLVPKIKARDFFYTTELCHYAERAGEEIVELPVSPDGILRASTVRSLHDGLGMARELLRLRREDRG
jgi:glycosyltransferase involved in cell wall biosynthesis